MKPITFQHPVFLLATLLCCAVFFWHQSPSPCLAETPEDIARRLQQRYDQISSLRFQFTQSTEGTLSGRSQQGSGEASFVKEKKGPSATGAIGRMRWDYTIPEKQVLVSDGENFFMYFAKQEQMIISPAASMQSDITYAFFTGTGDLLRDFSITPANVEWRDTAMTDKDLSVIRLTPRESQSQVSEIHLWVTGDSLIRRMEILDHFDTRTSLHFSNLQIDTLPVQDTRAMEALFTFSPPEGTEIIYQ